ncbi:PAAR-like domain-containing protein [Vitiosangium sp. GDMCC 1.1324]|uniref:PAAR-like domain-containing protein n=1 Tax=Vitiosangium sp. (strain GDMCC 1.1324) TaxID=2138576 RepID=UPI00130ED83B|nr:PAAR-like domain-containing protein [Vitiosangium sp. GDMCC 1.1324]
MSGKVYANGNEVVRKGGDGKVTAAFPDVCMSPPPPPAGPVPVPYADSSSANDLKAGSRTVQIAGKEVALQDESHYQTSPLGNEAATRNFGASVVTHTITGKTYFASWSMDVKVEGKGVVRHMDLTTSNHGSYPGATPPLPNLSEAQVAQAQQLALQRMQEGKCPCCGEESCPAAFKEDDEPLTMEEFYGLDSKDPRREQYDYLKECKEKLCTCAGRVFPEPPCDVFRAKNEKRYASIVNAWEGPGVKSDYRERYWEMTGIKLKISMEFMGEFLVQHKDADALRKAGKASRSELQKNAQLMRYRQEYDALKLKANRLERINHVVPKEAGGCPKNPGNLQPQQTLCGVCQEIDQFFTDEWQGR